jgi:hypothetical protein
MSVGSEVIAKEDTNEAQILGYFVVVWREFNNSKIESSRARLIIV